MKRIFAIVLALALTLGCAALAESELRVTGTGAVYVQADRVSASLGISLTGEDLAEVQQLANNTVASVVEELEKAGLPRENISTNYIYISPRYDYSGESEKLIGYTVTNTMTITTGDIDNIGTYIDVAFAAGANTFDSITFSVADDSEARHQALQLAVEDAQQKADVIAGASGTTLGGIDEIVEGAQGDYYNSTSMSGVNYEMAASDAAGAGTTVRAAQVCVTASVQITYELK